MRKKICFNDNVNARRKNCEQTDSTENNHEVKHKNNKILQKKLQN